METHRRLVKPPRCWLFVPGTAALRFSERAAHSRADAVIFDLEDSVTAEGVAEARAQIREAAQRIDRSRVALRIRSVEAESLREDMRLAAVIGASIIVVPKVRGASQIIRAASAARQQGVTDVGLIAMLESADAVLNASEIASSDPGVAALCLGVEDYAASLSLVRTVSGVELQNARGLVVMAAAAYGRWAIDGPPVHLRDVRSIIREARMVRALGFAGKVAVHPDQVDPIRAGMSLSRSERELAKALAAAYRDGVASGRAVVSAQGRMVDAPVAKAAERMLAAFDEGEDQGREHEPAK